MYYLFLDCSQAHCNIAIIFNDKVINKISILTNNNLTDLVVEYIDKLLSKSKITSRQIKKMYVVHGPGSFTGIKVATIIGKTWYLVNKTPIYFISSLLMQTNDGNGISVINAKSNMVYIACYKNYRPLLKPQIINISEIAKIKSKFSKYKIFDTYNPNHYFNNLMNYLRYSQKINNINSLIPLYLKKPVYDQKTNIK